MRVERCFAFVDLSGFTAFTERHGDEHTVAVLASFRNRVREIAARRGVRVTKWLGDGAMLSSTDTEPVVSMVIELGATERSLVPLSIRAGMAQGPVIMFEGDDYIGRAANVASRLCDSAAPTQVLATRRGHQPGASVGGGGRVPAVPGHRLQPPARSGGAHDRPERDHGGRSVLRPRASRPYRAGDPIRHRRRGSPLLLPLMRLVVAGKGAPHRATARISLGHAHG